MRRTKQAHKIRVPLLALALAATLAGCTLPRSGPTANEIFAAARAEGGAVEIVPVNIAVARAATYEDPLGFGSDFLGAGPISADMISPGDLLTVTVWENVDTGLLAGVGQRVTALNEVQVDAEGRIYVPYAGLIPAAGRSPDALRQEIIAALAPQTPDPQVEVRRAAGVGSTVSVIGAVASQGVYPIEAPTRRLSGMLAQAGGVAIEPDVAQVKVERSGRTGRVWLQDLYDNPRNDIALRAGDRVIVEQDRRSFTALGATGQQRIPFTKRDLTLVEALAEAGGLNASSADPTGVFVFREEPAEVARRVTGRFDIATAQRVAYVVNLTEPTGLFSARDFIVRDEDTIYVTEAPVAAWSRVLSIAGQTLNTTGNAASLSQGF